MTTTPTPRPLVEEYGVRLLSGTWFGSYPERDSAEWRASKEGATVVPLVAADRLTDDVLAEVCAVALAREEGWGDNAGAPQRRATRAVLAALRAHLEESA